MPRKSPEDQKFDDYLKLLSAFRKEHGHCTVQRSHPTLGRWMHKVRQEVRKGKLRCDWYERLIEIGCLFTFIDPYSEADLRYHFTVLADYRKEVGPGVPNKHHKNPQYASLGRWIERLQRNHVGNLVPKHVLKRIKDLNIPLERSKDKKPSTKAQEHASFSGNFKHLQSVLNEKFQTAGSRDLAYKESKKDAAIGKAYRFVEHMIRKQKLELLPAAHAADLISLDFTWNGKPFKDVLFAGPSVRSPLHSNNVQIEPSFIELELATDTNPNAMLNDLKVFQKKFGHCHVTRNYKDYQSLAYWCEFIRSQWLAGRLDANLIIELANIRFPFTPSQEEWNDQYGLLRAFHKEFGHAKVPRDYDDAHTLPFWIMHQGQLAKAGALPVERRQALMRLGLDFEGNDPFWKIYLDWPNCLYAELPEVPDLIEA